MSNLSYLTLETSDTIELKNQTSYWGIFHQQLSSASQYSIECLSVEGLRLAKLRYDANAFMKVNSLSGKQVVLLVPLGLTNNVLYNGTLLGLGETIVVNQDTCDLRIDGFFEAYIVVIPEKLLSSKVKQSPSSGAWLFSTLKINELITTINTAFNNYEVVQKLQRQEAIKIYLDAIASLFLNNPQRKYTLESKMKQLAKAIDVLLTDEHYPQLNLKYICDRLDTNERSLNYAFNQYYGVSPMAFIKSSKLHRARELLLEADPDEVNVTEIANRLGFWQLGQFSQDYKALFNELPSDTLNYR